MAFLNTALFKLHWLQFLFFTECLSAVKHCLRTWSSSQHQWTSVSTQLYNPALRCFIIVHPVMKGVIVIITIPPRKLEVLSSTMEGLNACSISFSCDMKHPRSLGTSSSLHSSAEPFLVKASSLLPFNSPTVPSPAISPRVRWIKGCPFRVSKVDLQCKSPDFLETSLWHWSPLPCPCYSSI